MADRLDEKSAEAVVEAAAEAMAAPDAGEVTDAPGRGGAAQTAEPVTEGEAADILLSGDAGAITPSRPGGSPLARPAGTSPP